MIQDRPGSAVFTAIASDLLANGRGFRFQAKGRSMAPTINDGDVLHVVPIGKRKPKVGEIVLFRCREGLKAHRILRKNREFIVTRGDAGVEHDGEIPLENILGLVTAKTCVPTARTVQLTGIKARCLFAVREIRRRMVARKRVTVPAEARTYR